MSREIIICFAVLLFCAKVCATTTNIVLGWDVVSNAAGYKIFWGTAANADTNIVQVGPTNMANVTNLIQFLRYYFAAATINADGISGTNSAVISGIAGDTNVYVRQTNTMPWYQARYGPNIVGTNWANFGAPFRGQFTNLHQAFLRLWNYSNEVIGVVIQTNPPAEPQTVAVPKLFPNQ